MTPSWKRRLKLAVAGLLAAASVAIPALQLVDAQTPPVVERLVIVNEDEEKPFIERKKNGEFRARPIFNLRLSRLTYGIRDADSGEWLTAIYRVNGGEDERDKGWEVRLRLPGAGRAARARSGAALPLGDRGAGGRPRDANHVLRDHPRAPAGRHLQQDSGRAQP